FSSRGNESADPHCVTENSLRPLPNSRHAILFPHSGQNFVPASNFVPHLPHSFLGRSAVPHSGQNFAPCVCAPHAGHSATASVVRSMPLVRSCCCSFCFIWSTVVCTCAEASSVSMSGAHS